MSSLVPALEDEYKEKRTPDKYIKRKLGIFDYSRHSLFPPDDISGSGPDTTANSGGGVGGAPPPPPTGHISYLYYNIAWNIPPISRPDMLHCTIAVTTLSFLSKVEACRATLCIIISITTALVDPLCTRPLPHLLLLLMLLLLSLCPSCPFFSSSILCTLPLPLLLLILLFNSHYPFC